MKTLSIVNLHKAEIKKNQLAKIKGGIEIKCVCTTANPFVSTKKMSGTTHLCACDSTVAEAGIFSRPEK